MRRPKHTRAAVAGRGGSAHALRLVLLVLGAMLLLGAADADAGGDKRQQQLERQEQISRTASILSFLE